MLKAAAEHDAEMLASVVNCGAWLDYTEEDTRNTALHIVVINCQDRSDYLYEAERLGLKVTDNGCDLITKLKPASRDAKLQLEEDIRLWKERNDGDTACVQALCDGHADPLLQNGMGKTCLELAKGKDPKIMKMLEDQVMALEKLAAEAEAEEENNNRK